MFHWLEPVSIYVTEIYFVLKISGKKKVKKNAWKQLRVIKDTVFYWNLLQNAEEPLLSKNGVSYDLSNNCSSQPHSNFSSALTAWMSTSNGWSPISETRKYFFFRIKFQIKSMLLRRSSCLVSHRKKVRKIKKRSESSMHR